MKKPFNKYFIILMLGFLLWIAETAYFGFNKTPQSGAEGLADAATALMMIYGVIGDLSRNVRITKSYHNVTNNRINTKKVEVTGEDQVVNNNTTVNVTPQVLKKVLGAKND